MRMNRLMMTLMVTLLLSLSSCEGQQEKQVTNVMQVSCNRKVYGSQQFIKLLPS